MGSNVGLFPGKVNIGVAQSSATDAITGANELLELAANITAPTTRAALLLSRVAGNNGVAPEHSFYKSRGTLDVPLNVQINDTLSLAVSYAYSTGWFAGGLAQFVVDAAVVAGQAPATRYEIWTNANNAVALLGTVVDRNGFFGVGVVPSFQFDVQKTNAGATVTGRVKNLSAAANSIAYFTAEVSGAFKVFSNYVSTTNAWSAGLDPTDSDKYKISNNVLLGSSNKFSINTAGCLCLGSGADNAAPDAWGWFAGESLTSNDLVLQSSANSILNSVFTIRKSRGSVAAPTDIVNGDYFGSLNAQGYSAGWFDTASVRFATAAAIVSGQRPASQIEFWTGPNNTSPARRGYIASDGTWTLNTNDSGGSCLNFVTAFTAAPSFPAASSLNILALKVTSHAPALRHMFKDGASNRYADVVMTTCQNGGDSAGRLKMGIHSISVGDSPYTATIDDALVLAFTAGGSVAVTLPSALLMDGEILSFKKVEAGNTLSISPALGEAIEQVVNGTISITALNQNTMLIASGVDLNWYIL